MDLRQYANGHWITVWPGLCKWLVSLPVSIVADEAAVFILEALIHMAYSFSDLETIGRGVQVDIQHSHHKRLR